MANRVPDVTGSPASIDEALEFVADLATGGSSAPRIDLVETAPNSQLFRKVAV